MKKKAITITDVKVLVGTTTISYKEEEFTHTVTSKKIPHPDFINAIEGIKIPLAKLFEVKEERIFPKGISLSGEDKCQLKGTLEILTKSQVSIHSNPIDLVDTTLGFENDINDAVNEIVKEAKLFLEGKESQQEINFDKEDKNKEE